MSGKGSESFWTHLLLFLQTPRSVIWFHSTIYESKQSAVPCGEWLMNEISARCPRELMSAAAIWYLCRKWKVGIVSCQKGFPRRTKIEVKRKNLRCLVMKFIPIISALCLFSLIRRARRSRRRSRDKSLMRSDSSCGTKSGLSPWKL